MEIQITDSLRTIFDVLKVDFLLQLPVPVLLAQLHNNYKSPEYIMCWHYLEKVSSYLFW